MAETSTDAVDSENVAAGRVARLPQLRLRLWLIVCRCYVTVSPRSESLSKQASLAGNADSSNLTPREISTLPLDKTLQALQFWLSMAKKRSHFCVG